MGSVPAAAQAEPVPQLVGGRFTVESLLGQGGMGAVYAVRDVRSGRRLALKRLTLDDEKDRKRLSALFEREYSTLARLDHPSIIHVYEYGIDEIGAFYTMELLDGADMRELSPLPYPRACRYLREVLGSLALLHARGLVHRDVTPRNVRLTSDDRCKLIDFGALSSLGSSAEVVGTAASIPPEALERKPLDQRVDLYAVGCLAYWMLTGRHAYPAADARQLPAYWARPPGPPSAICPEHAPDGAALPAIPAELDELVLAMLRLDPLSRPSSADAVIDRLDAIAGREARDDLDVADSYLSSTTLVGRDGSTAEAQRLLRQLATGRGAALGFAGPTGIGKTRLLREIALDAQLAGARVLQVDADEHERPYSAAAALGRQLLELAPNDALAAAEGKADVLGHLIEELREQLGRVALAERPDDPIEWRTRLQSCLRAWFVEAARRRPLVLILDNSQRCDVASATAIASLAHAAKQAPLLVVFAHSGAVDDALFPASLGALRQVARVSELSGLGPKETETWFESLFGNTPNLPRLAEFLHGRSQGNPGACLELVRFLIDSGEVRYRDGTWVLPTEPAKCRLPSGAQAIARERLELLDVDLRGFAQALAIHRGALGLELCRALTGDDGTGTVERRLDALLEHGILQYAGAAYRFASEPLREAAAAQLDDARRPELQRRLAAAILARQPLHLSEKLEAGVHLLQAGDPRGTRIVCEAAADVMHNLDAIGACTRNFELAHGLMRARGASPYEMITVLSALGLGAYMVDRRLERYADELVHESRALLGFELTARLRPWLGKRMSAFAGMAVAAIRHAFQPRRVRFGSFSRLAQMAAGAVIALCGRAAICLDGPAARRLAAAMEPLAALGRMHAGAFAHDYCVGLCLMTQDRLAATYAHFLDLEARLLTPGSFRDVPADVRRLWIGGVDYVLGVLEGFAGDPQVLRRAEALERTGTDVHDLIAAQLRLQYHGFRGEADEVRKAFARMEACAIQTGYSWQVETWSAIAINLFGALWNDLILTKRTMDETVRLAPEVPTLARYAESSRATYLLGRGQLRECVQVYREMLPEEEPRDRIGWTTSLGLLAEAHNQLGEFEEARRLCENALREADPRDAIYYGLRLNFDLALVGAYAALGQYDAARAELERLFALHERHQSPFALGAIHEAAARAALAQGDRKGFSEHLRATERQFCALGNPSLIARFRNLAELGGSEGGVAARIAQMRELNAFERAMARLGSRELAARHVLSWVVERHAGFTGHLFVQQDDEPQLLAATDDAELPEEAIALVRRTLAALGSDHDTTVYGTEAMTVRERADENAHVYLLSYLEADDFHAEGAIVLSGTQDVAPQIRYELLQIAAQHLNRLRSTATG